MPEDNTIQVLTNILQQKSNSLGNDELFGLLSLTTLLEIVKIFNKDTINSSTVSSNTNESPNLPSVNNLTGLLSQFQNNNSGNNLQQLLPLLMSSMGSGNNSGNNLDIGSLMNMVNTLKGNMQNTEDKNQENENSDEEEENSQTKTEDKKKVQSR